MLSHGFVEDSVVASVPVIARRINVSVSSRPSRSDAAVSGQSGRALRRAARAAARPGSGSVSDHAARVPAADLVAVALGQRVRDIPFLVTMASTAEGVLGLDVLN